MSSKSVVKNNGWELGIWSETGPDSSGWIGRSEREMVRFLEKEMGGLDEDGKLAIVFTSLFLKGGHTSLPLDQSPKKWGEILGLEPAITESLPGRLIDPNRLIEQKLAGSDKDTTLLKIQGSRLSIYKYYNLESKLLQWFTRKDKNNYNTDISKYISKICPKSDKKEVDWQKIAMVMSTFRKRLILSGGPGTGKTTTIARILVLNRLMEERPLRIALTAPTGKAASRMGEALLQEMDRLSELLDEFGLERDLFPKEAKTVHRLLAGTEKRGILPPVQKQFLPYDLIVVDEASMMDLELMSRLITHIGPTSRLILMGDKNQLSSVEAGSVFADICQKNENGFSSDVIESLRQCGVEDPVKEVDQSPLDDSIVYLTKSYRFDESSGIGRLAQIVNSGDGEDKKRVMKYDETMDPEKDVKSGGEENDGEVVKNGGMEMNRLQKLFDQYDDLSHEPFAYEKTDMDGLLERFIVRVSEAMQISEPEEMFAHWKRSVWLSPLRSGLTGTERLNRLLERYILAEIRPQTSNEWYHGRPVIVTQNDYSTGVFNGDLGVCMQEGGHFWIYIETGSQVKRVRPDRIRHLEPFYFLTVHKSQGSEFDEVNLLMPPKDHQLLTRELIYTAITRARSRFRLYGGLELFEAGVKRKTERYTGLRGVFDLRSQISD